MQEKRNKRLAIAFVALIAVIVLVSFSLKKERPFSVDLHLYNDVDLNAVDRVILESSAGKTDLHFDRYRWKVNDSIAADRGLVEVLFATLKQAQPKRPVATSLRDSTISQLKSKGVKVTLYEGQKALKSFYAGGNESKTQAIFLLQNAEDGHIMTIPGYRVYVSGIFEVPPVGWMDKLIFNFQWQNFNRLEARYKNPIGNFDVVMEKNQVFIPQIADADTAKLNSYLDQVSLLTVEEYITANHITDSLASTTPILHLTVLDIANRSYKLTVFTSRDQFYARVAEKYWARLNENDIIPLLRPKDFFVKR
jgi:hypothetical protein